MVRFELSEQWCPWRELDLIFVAARAAIEAGPFDPFLCEVVFNDEFDPFIVDTLEQAQDDLRRNPRMMSMEIMLSHIDEDAANVSLRYSGERLQLRGQGSDWDRARAAYDAAQDVLAGHFGITALKLPKRPVDTVAETRKRLVIEGLEAAFEGVEPPPSTAESPADRRAPADAPQADAPAPSKPSRMQRMLRKYRDGPG
jgi:hypothetical protein